MSAQRLAKCAAKTESMEVYVQKDLNKYREVRETMSICYEDVLPDIENPVLARDK